MFLTQNQVQTIKNRGLNDLYFFEKFILGYRDMVPQVHLPLCRFIQQGYTRKQVTLPRGFFKTTVCTVGRSIWLAVRNPEIRILIASNVVENAGKMLHMIRMQFEQNNLLRQLYPEVIPANINKVRWSDRCLELNRKNSWPEGTFEVIGVGGSKVSLHYDHIIEDDLIYAKKDDLTEMEIQPGREDIEKAIGWHKLASSLLIRPNEGVIDNIGTRWAPYDLIGHIRKNEGRWKHFEMNVFGQTANPRTDLAREGGDPIWPDRFSHQTIDKLYDDQGPFMHSTQYICRPLDPSQKVFKEEWLQYYDTLPAGLKYFTTVDLAGWDEAKGGRNKKKSYNVILTAGIDHRRHIWVARVDRGRWTPRQVVEIINQHREDYNVERVGIEVVYYQKAILEEIKRYYEDTGKRIPVAAIEREANVSKGARIRALEPVASRGCLHIRPNEKALLEEYRDYPASKTVDCLDALADQLRIAIAPTAPEEEVESHPFRLDEILEEFQIDSRRGIGMFKNQVGMLIPMGGQGIE